MTEPRPPKPAMLSRRVLLAGLPAAAAAAYIAGRVHGGGEARSPRLPGGLPLLDVRAFGATGDGSTDDRPAIQRAIDSAPSDGATVVFPPGTYVVEAPSIVVQRPSIHLLGLGVARLLLPRAGARCLLVKGTTDIRVTDLAFDYEGGVRSQGLAIQNSSRVVVRGCQFRTFGRYGVVVSGVDEDSDFQPCNDIRIEGCLFEDIGTVGLNVFPKRLSSNVEVVGNTFRRCGLNPSADEQDGAAVKPGQFVLNGVCTGNVFEGCHNGVAVANWATLVVAGNTFRDITDFAIAVSYSPHRIYGEAPFRSAVIAGNVFTQTDAKLDRSVAINVNGGPSDGTEPGPLHFTANRVDGLKRGLYVHLSGPVEALVIDDNSFSKTVMPIQIDGGEGQGAVALTLRGNQVAAGKAAPTVEVHGDGALVAYNVFIGCGSVQLSPATPDGAMTVIGNVFRDPRPTSDPAVAARMTTSGTYTLARNIVEETRSGLLAGFDAVPTAEVRASDNQVPANIPTFTSRTTGP